MNDATTPVFRVERDVREGASRLAGAVRDLYGQEHRCTAEGRPRSAGEVLSVLMAVVRSGTGEAEPEPPVADGFDPADPATYGVPEAVNLLASVLGVRDGETATEAIRRCLTPPSPYPEGVHRAPDGTLLARGAAVRSLDDTWQRRYAIGSDSYAWNSAPHRIAAPGRWYEVRRVPDPDTELVPWWEAVGRKLPDGREVIKVGRHKWNPAGWVEVAEPYAADFADADGRVLVLRDTQDGEG